MSRSVSSSRVSTTAGMPITSSLVARAGGAAALLAAAGIAVAELLPKADRVIVFKARRELQLLRDGELLKSYPIALGPRPKGPKRRKGDGRTPEGVYYVDGRNPR